MSKKDKRKHKCFVCGKMMTDYEKSQNCYVYGNQIACYDHTGIEEWYNEMREKGDKTVCMPMKLAVR